MIQNVLLCEGEVKVNVLGLNGVTTCVFGEKVSTLTHPNDTVLNVDLQKVANALGKSNTRLVLTSNLADNARKDRLGNCEILAVLLLELDGLGSLCTGLVAALRRRRWAVFEPPRALRL